jgi:thiamine pyrophosphate-dependent acetolactate synthase large subunit-like protein
MDVIRSGAEAIVERLRAHGVRTVFGLVGSSTMDLFDVLYDAEDIRFIGCRDERSGTNMADAYARVSGELGVMIAGQSGPGVTNTVTGVTQANMAFSPVLIIAGAIARKYAYTDGFQEVDQQRIFEAITKRTYSVATRDRLAPVVDDAITLALSGRPGPVVVNVPRDVLAASAADVAMQPPREIVDVAPPVEATARMASMLRDAQRPVIIAGGGIKRRGRYHELIHLAELLSCPVVMSAGHGDAVPNDHPLAGGQFGPRGNPVATETVREADVILALGTRLGFNSTFTSTDYISPKSQLIHVDVHAEAVGRYFPAALAVCADAPRVALDLARELEGHAPTSSVRQWTSNFQTRVAEFRREREEAADGPATPISPDRAFKALRAVLPRNSVVTLDAGTLNRQATDALSYFTPPALITPLDFGCVGFSLGAALGAKAAAPDRPVICIAGDGGFSMSISELSTAVQERLDVNVVVLNNGCWGAEKAYQREFFSSRYIGVELTNPPFCELAELYGAKGFYVGSSDALERTLAAAIEYPGPTVVDIAIDPEAFSAFDRGSFAHRQ